MARRTDLGGLLSEAALRRIAGAAYFQRGVVYLSRGAVSNVRMTQGKITAAVQGTRRYGVRLWVQRGELAWSCSCPLGEEGEACKHVVAAGLAWLKQRQAVESDGPGEDETAVLEPFLRKMSQAALVRLILERAKEDDGLSAWLLVKAQGKGAGSPKTALRAIERAFELPGHMDYHDTPGYVSQVEQAVDLLQATLQAGDHTTAAELSEYALRLGFAAGEQIDDSDGEFGATLEQIAEIHVRASARQAVPGPQLADRLFALVMADPWGVVSVDAYGKALGRDGKERFREHVQREWEKLPALQPGSRRQDSPGKRFLLKQLMEEFARQTGGVDAMVALEQRDLSYPAAFLRIAELLKKAKRYDEALAWAERGAKTFPGRPMGELVEFLVAEYQRRKQYDRALALRWQEFQTNACLETYRLLERSARAANSWPEWRARALDLLHSKAEQHPRAGAFWGTNASSVLTEIHLAEGDVAAALIQARAGGCSQTLWFKVAAACEPGRPGDAVAIYLEHLEPIINGKNDRAYDEATALLRKVGALMRRQGQAAAFLDVVAGVLTRHKAKRNLMKRLERVAAEARKMGGG